MALTLPPLPELRSCIESVWASDAATRPGSREHVLPSGRMHLAVRLQGGAVRLFADAADRIGTCIGDAVVAGARAGYYIKDMAVPARSVGVVLRPGAALALFGVSAAELHGSHVALDDLWGEDAQQLRERLHEASDPRAQLDVLQAMLLARHRAPRALHPSVAQALLRMEGDTDIGSLVEGADLSHRHFIARFRDATGLSPKRYARVLRFRRLLRAFAAAPAQPWLVHALDAGYSDQSHCIREFREFAGTTPEVWRTTAGGRGLHVPVASPNRQS